MTEQSKIQQTIHTLKQQRDELALKIHLGAADAKDEFERAKAKLDQMSRQYDPLKKATAESAGSLFASMKLVGEEVRDSFNRIRKSL